MNFDLLLDNFDLLLNSSNQINKLNQAILQLAVQGKLVSQDPTDEPASELIKHIKAKRSQLIREGILKNEKQLPPISRDEVPYELPKRWIWVRLGEIYHDLGQKRPDEEFTYIDVSSIDNERGVITNNLQILSPESAPSRARKLVKKGTVIYSTVRPYLLNIAVVDRDFYPSPIISTAFAVMHPFEGIFNKYLYFYLRSKRFIEFVESKMVGMAYPAINDSQLSMGLFPLPPLNEQVRIVTKIERLLKKSQEIEIQLTQAGQDLINLNKAALSLFDAKDIDGFQERWQFILDNFDLLYSDERNISDLKQAILQLAVQGKLVPQDPADEPAAELLKRIKAEKDRLIREGKIKREKPLPPISEDEIPYELPEGWVLMRLGEVCETITKGSSPNWQGISYVDKNEGVLFITSKNVGQYKLVMDEVNYVESKFNEIEPRSILRNGDILMNIVGASIGRTAIYNLNEVANINKRYV